MFDRENLATNDRPFVRDACELADRKSPILLEHRALGPQSTQGRRFALKIGEIRLCIASRFDLVRSNGDLAEFDQWGRPITRTGAKELAL